MSDVQKWLPEIAWLGHDHGQVNMKPSKAGMWVSVADHDALAAEVTRLRETLARVTAERDEARLSARQFNAQNNALQDLLATSPVGMAFDNLATARAEGVEAGLLQARNAIAASGQLEPADFLAVAHILHALIPAPPAPPAPREAQETSLGEIRHLQSKLSQAEQDIATARAEIESLQEAVEAERAETAKWQVLTDTARSDGVAEGLRMAADEALAINEGLSRRDRQLLREWHARIMAPIPAPAKPAGGWLLIETAPKDGEEVDIGHAIEAWVCAARYHADAGEWREVNNDPTDAWGQVLYPTHWRTRPAPPAPREGGDTITITVPRRLLPEMVQWAEDELSRALEDTAFERDLRRALLLLRALDPAKPREGGEG